MTNRAKIHEFYKKVRGNLYLSSHSFEIWLFTRGCGSWQQMQNVSKISIKLCQLGPNTGTMGCEYMKYFINCYKNTLIIQSLICMVHGKLSHSVHSQIDKMLYDFNSQMNFSVYDVRIRLNLQAYNM